MEKNTAIQFTKNLFKEVWTDLNEEKLLEYYDTNLVGHFGEITITFQDVKNRLQFVKNHYQWIKNNLRDVLVDGDKIVVRLDQTYCQKDTAKLEEYKLMAIYRIANSKVIEAWAMISPDVDYFEN